MTSDEITIIENEVIRLTALCDSAKSTGNRSLYMRYKGRVEDLQKNLDALKDLDDRIE